MTINSKEKNVLKDKAFDNFTDYINKIFNENLTSNEDVFEFMGKKETAEDVFACIKNIDILPNCYKSVKGIDKKMSDFLDTGKYTKHEIKSIGEGLGTYFFSQFIRVQEHKYYCNKFIAEPIYDHDAAWFFFNYEIGGMDMDAAIANSLQKEKFEWISNVPLKALKILREEDKLEYMRSLLRKGITDLKTKNDKDLLDTANQLDKNFKEAFKQQTGEIKELEKQIEKIVKIEAPIATGGFLAGFIPVLGNVVSIASFGKEAKDLYAEHEQKKQEKIKKENNFINLLMKSYD